MTLTKALAQEKIWIDRAKYIKAEIEYYEQNAKQYKNTPMANEVAMGKKQLAKLKKKVKNNPEKNTSEQLPAIDVNALKFFEKKLLEIQEVFKGIESRFTSVESRLQGFEKHFSQTGAVDKEIIKQDDDNNDVDLFGSESEEESEEAAKVRNEKLAAYNAKKSKKPQLVAKSNIILDIKPWDDETDMVKLQEEVRKIHTDGLMWGAAKLVPLAYGIKKLQISCVVEDEKVSIDWLQEEIEKLENYVQSVDIAAFNKV